MDVTTLAPCIRLMSFVVPMDKEPVGPLISHGSSRTGAMILTATLRMIPPALSLALLDLTTKLCSVLWDLLM